MKNLQHKIAGSMLGGAVGDALGYAVEFLPYSRIIARYGSDGITRYELKDGVAEISDDTQMSLYTAAGLLAGDIQDAYLEWYHLQTNPRMIENPRFAISRLAVMSDRRAPGCTCLSALSALDRGLRVSNHSKGCGGIMRVAPIALYGAAHHADPVESARQACAAARLTHLHPLGWMPAGVLAYTIHRIVEEDLRSREAIIATAREAMDVVGCFAGAEADATAELRRGSELAIALSHDELPDEQAIRRLGEGWTGEEAWYIALYCTLRYVDDFERAIVAAVNHSGDSDSTGAVAGNLMGAILGLEAIPEHLRERLEIASEIEKMAQKLTE